MNIIKKIIGESFIYIVIEFLFKVVGFFAFVIIARKYGSIVIGQFSFASSMVVIFFAVADFGISNMIIREIAINKKKAGLNISNALYIKLLSSILVVLFVCVLTVFLDKSYGVKLLIYIVIIHMFIKTFSDFMGSVLKAYEKISYVFYLRIIENVVFLSFFAIFIFLNVPFQVLIFSFIIASFFSLVISIYIVNKKIVNLSMKKESIYLKKIIRKSMPFGLSLILFMLYFNTDTLMVSFFYGDKVTGIYAISYSLFLSSLIFIQLLPSILLPILSRKMMEFDNSLNLQRKLIKKVLFYGILLVFIGVVISVFLILFADIIVWILYGEEFIQSAKSLKILALIIPFWYIYMIISIIFTSFGRQYYVTYTLFVGVTLNIILNLFLIPSYAEVGASFASLITAIVLMIMVVAKILFMDNNYKNYEKYMIN